MLEHLRVQFAASGVGLWYQSLEVRERLALNVLVSFLLVTVLYLGVWQPIHEWRDATERTYVRHGALLEWMRANENAARRAGGFTRSPRTGGSLLSLVANSAPRHALTLTRYQPEGSDGVGVSLQDASFDALIAWLDELNRTRAVTVRQLTVTRLNEPGRVSATLTVTN